MIHYDPAQPTDLSANTDDFDFVELVLDYSKNPLKLRGPVVIDELAKEVDGVKKPFVFYFRSNTSSEFQHIERLIVTQAENINEKIIALMALKSNGDPIMPEAEIIRLSNRGYGELIGEIADFLFDKRKIARNLPDEDVGKP